MIWLIAAFAAFLGWRWLRSFDTRYPLLDDDLDALGIVDQRGTDRGDFIAWCAQQRADDIDREWAEWAGEAS